LPPCLMHFRTMILSGFSKLFAELWHFLPPKHGRTVKLTNIPEEVKFALWTYHQHGIPEGPALAIVSVLYAGESKLRTGPQWTTMRTDRGGAIFSRGAYGIASWNGTRQEKLLNFAREHELPVSDMATQLLFILTECADNYPHLWEGIKRGQDTHSFITAFVNEYERPKEPSQEIVRAQAFASEIQKATAIWNT